MNKDGKTKAITLGKYLSSLEKKLEDAKEMTAEEYEELIELWIWYGGCG